MLEIFRTWDTWEVSKCSKRWSGAFTEILGWRQISRPKLITHKKLNWWKAETLKRALGTIVCRMFVLPSIDNYPLYITTLPHINTLTHTHTRTHTHTHTHTHTFYLFSRAPRFLQHFFHNIAPIKYRIKTNIYS